MFIMVEGGLFRYFMYRNLWRNILPDLSIHGSYLNALLCIKVI